MSTKATEYYAEHDVLSIHIFKDYARQGGMRIRLNGTSYFVPMSESERAELIDALKEGFN